MKLTQRIQNAWNAFMNKDPTDYIDYDLGPSSYYYRPDRPRLVRGSEKSIVNSIITRIAMDAAATEIKHVRLDDDGRMIEVIDSDLNRCLTRSANIDQSARTFLVDLILTMLDEGVSVIVPTSTDEEPDEDGDKTLKIYEMRVGRVVQWYPRHVKLSVWDDIHGKKEEIILPKTSVAILENPFYTVMNEPNSTMQRLVRKLGLLDVVDEHTSSGKLDLIIQLPYVIKNQLREDQAEKKRQNIENQIANSKLGIAYTDGTEKIVQLNKPLENNLLKQVEFLTKMVQDQLGITPEILNNTATADVMNNYYNRLIEPILSYITEEMTRKFLSDKAVARKQEIKYYRDPFKIIPINNLAEIADTLIRNEILTGNEMRQIIGMKPSGDPRSDTLRNPNMPVQDEQLPYQNEGYDDSQEQLAQLDDNDAQLDSLEQELGLGHSGILAHYASKYYDPVKAHQYYEEHKQLKGRTSSAQSDSDEKYNETKAYVKNRINTERNSKLSSVRNNQSQRLENESTNLKNQVESLRTFLKQMSPEQRKQEEERIKEQIDSLRQKNAEARAKIQQESSARSAKITSDYSDKYAKELEKINAEFGKGKKGAGGGIVRNKKRAWRNI